MRSRIVLQAALGVALVVIAGAAAAAPVEPAAASAPTLPPAAPSDDGGFAAVRQAADAAFRERDDAGRLAVAIARYREAATLRPGDRGVLVALARAEAFRAQIGPTDARDAWRECSRAAERALRAAAPRFAEAIDRGEDAGKAAAVVDHGGAEPLYWMALCTMGMAQSRGMAAVLAVKDAARAMMQRAAELDERTDFGGPRRALGAWLATLPSAAGGGAGAARAQLERARSLFPLYQLTKIRDAEALAVLLQDGARFDTLLGEVLAFDVGEAPDIAPENRLAQRLARGLVARRDRLF
jgi:hypothetical protein